MNRWIKTTISSPPFFLQYFSNFKVLCSILVDWRKNNKYAFDPSHHMVVEVFAHFASSARAMGPQPNLMQTRWLKEPIMLQWVLLLHYLVMLAGDGRCMVTHFGWECIFHPSSFFCKPWSELAIPHFARHLLGFSFYDVNIMRKTTSHSHTLFLYVTTCWYDTFCRPFRNLEIFYKLYVNTSLQIY